MVGLVDEIRGHTSENLFSNSKSIRASSLLPFLLGSKGIFSRLLSFYSD